MSPVPPAQPLPHGYNHAPPPADDSSIHPELRSAGETYPPVPIPNMMPAAIPTHDQANIMSGPIPAMSAPAAGMDPNDPNADGRKNKRELSQSKRAAQNRAAQVSVGCPLPCFLGPTTGHLTVWLGLQTMLKHDGRVELEFPARASYCRGFGPLAINHHGCFAVKSGAFPTIPRSVARDRAS